MFAYTSIQHYQAALREGSLTCAGTLQQYLERIRSLGHLNAFTAVFEEEARVQASRLDERRRAGSPMGRLHGVIIGIKDVICYKDHPVTASSKMLQGFTALYSATAVQRLLDEEAILIGMLNCDEFAMGSSNENSAYGPVRNYADETRVPGGSSGGSAVAVQAGLCMAALGSDTGGSVRQPADFCGLVGLKPGYGRISRHGLIAYASSFDQIGVLTQCVEDAALLLEIMAGPDEYDSTADPSPPPSYSGLLTSPGQPRRIAWFREALEHPGLDPEIRRALEETIRQLKAAGHTVEEVSFDLLDYVVPAYYVLTTAEASSNLGRYDGVRYGHRSEVPAGSLAEFYARNRTEGFGREVKRRIMLGSFVLSAGYYDAYYTRAQQVRRLLRDWTDRVFESYDFLMMPNSPVTAFKLGEKMEDPLAMYLADIYTVMANLTGVPAISLPLYRHSNGLPFGLQLIANRRDELSLLQMARQLMPSGKD